MCVKVTETIGRSSSKPQLLLVALQCGKQIEIADLLSCVPKSHHAVTSWSQPAWDGFEPVFILLVLWKLITFSGNSGMWFLS